MSNNPLPPLPSSWSALSWQQLWDCWTAKLRYGGNPDVARAAALLALTLGDKFFDERSGRAERQVSSFKCDPVTGEQRYLVQRDLEPETLNLKPETYVLTARSLAHLAKSLKWFDFPYGDPGKEAVKNEKGKVVEEAVEPVRGLVNPNWRDAMDLPEEEIVTCVRRISSLSQWEAMTEEERNQPIIDEWNAMKPEQRYNFISCLPLGKEEKELQRMAKLDWQHTDEQVRQQILHSSLFILHFALPELACNNITWHQYRTLQGLQQQMFSEGLTDEQALDLQAQFLAYILVPEEVSSFRYQVSGRAGARGGEALETWNLKPETSGAPRRDPFARPHRFRYDADRAAQSVAFWRRLLTGPDAPAAPLYAICFQVYHTALHYYEQVFPVLFGGGGKTDPLQDALTGEVGTINSVMKYQGYTDPQQVYDANLPIILSVLNTMTKEAKEIEKMNSRIKKK